MATFAGSTASAPGSSSGGSRSDSVVAATPAPSSSSTSTTVSAVTPKPSNAWSKSRYDTCGCDWTSGNPRTCSECLGVTLASGEPCAVTPFGQCMSASEIASLEQFFNFSTIVYSAGNYSVTHPHLNEKLWSTNATYCTTSDAMCTSCRANWIRGFQTDRFYSTTSFSCVGEGGCICTAYCEIRNASEVTMGGFYDFGEKCTLVDSRSVIGPNSSSRNATSSATLIVQKVLGLGIGFVVIIVVVRWGMSRFHQKRHDHRMEEQYRALDTQPRATSRFGPMLTLDGWNRHREQLVASEHARFGVDASESHLTEDPVVRVVVEAGAGFRSASPSHLSWQRWT